MKHLSHPLVFLLPVLLLAACHKAPTYSELGELEAQAFHQRFNAGKFSEIYADSTEGFRRTGSEESFTNFLAQVKNKLGSVSSVVSSTAESRSMGETIQVIVVQHVEFEKGSGTETFTCEIGKDRAVLMGYFPKSSLLSTK